MHKIYPHGRPEQISPALWELTGSLPFPLKRKMVIHRLADGTLLVHNLVAMDEDGMKALEALGRPSVMVVAHSMHTMDAAFYAERAAPRPGSRRPSRCPRASRRCPWW